MPAHLYGTPDEPPTFDVEEYRSDLQRRYYALTDAARQDHYAYIRTKDDTYFHAYSRKTHKADGIQIALDLLPRKAD